MQACEAGHPLVGAGEMELFAADMTAVFSGELTLAEAQEALKKVGQWLAVDGEPEAKLGTLIEENSTGPLRLGYGAWRDLLMGVQFRNGRGELITAGARAVKNVAGYDLTKFMVGQRGVFGTIVTLTVRTYKRPQSAMVARFGPEIERVGELMPTALRPHWMMLTKEALWCGYLGDEKAVEYYEAKVKDLRPVEVRRQSLEEDMALRAGMFRGEHRTAAPPAEILDFVRRHDLKDWVAEPAFGVVLYSGRGPLPQAMDEVQRKLLERLKEAF